MKDKEEKVLKTTHKLSINEVKEVWQEDVKMREATFKVVNKYLKDECLPTISMSSVIAPILHELHPEGLVKLGVLPYNILSKIRADLASGKFEHNADGKHKVTKEELRIMKL